MKTNWKKVKLEEISERITDGTHISPRYIEEGIPMLDSKNIYPGFIIDDARATKFISSSTDIELSKRCKPQSKDLLISSRGSIGKVAIVSAEQNFNIMGNMILVRTNERLYHRFLAYYLQYSIKQLQNISTGVAQKGLYLKDIRLLQIPLPPLKTQIKIANALDKADEIQKKRQETIDKMNDLVQSIFWDMFGDPVRNEKGWKVSELKTISTKILSGSTPKGGKQVYVKTGILFLRSQNVWRDNLVLDDVAYIDETIHKKMKKSSLRHKDLLMTKTGRFNTENSSLGRASIYKGEDDKANINGHVYLIRLKDKIIHEFILHILTTKQYRDYIRRVCVGGIDKRQLNKNHLEEFPIICPPKNLQIKFDSLKRYIKKQKKLLERELAKDESLFHSLLQRAFKGELEFNNE